MEKFLNWKIVLGCVDGSVSFPRVLEIGLYVGISMNGYELVLCCLMRDGLVFMPRVWVPVYACNFRKILKDLSYMYPLSGCVLKKKNNVYCIRLLYNA